jgi:hypothetical protein
LNQHYINFARNLNRQSKFDAALEITLARKQLWPRNGERLYSVAQQLAAIYSAMGGAEAPEQLQAACVRAAVTTLREAVAAGLPVERLRDASLSPLAASAEFQSLVKETTAAAQSSAKQASVN